MAEFSQTSTSLWCTGRCPVPRLTRRQTCCSREFVEDAAAKIHRTVQCANDARLQRSAERSTGDTWPSQQSLGRTRLSGVRRTLSGAPRGPRAQRSVSLEKEGDQAPDKYCSCLVVHRTVWCATRQKARIAFQFDLQRLLAALGL